MTLSARSLSVELSRRRVLAGVDVDLAPGELVGLLGANGAGKSTLIRALAGVLPFEGAVAWKSEAVAAMSHHTRAKIIAHLPQTRTIGWPMPVRDIVALGRQPWLGFGQTLGDADRAAVDAAMMAMDVAHLADRKATALSGGEQARVLAARAIAQSTPVLLADEPASGLDPAHQIAAMRALRQLASNGKAVLVSLHDLTLAARWCDRVIVLADGKLAVAGSPSDALTAETLASIFRVRARIVADDDGLLVAPIGLI